MKSFLLIGAASLLTSLASLSAEAWCSTNSRNYSFSGYDRVQTIKACERNPYTMIRECQANIRCDEDRCTSYSRGYYFSGRTSNEAINNCRLHPYSMSSDCSYYVRCQSYPPPGPGYPPPPAPAPPMTDGQCYLKRYPDICQNSANYCRDPWAHYVNHGKAEGRIWGCQRP